ncbi:hypothetical protein QZH41_011744 [Actinostola sp. cb2023]|nr:hypothetical protein QZH41_011744 [Actinostola sp. cb2023]
MPIQRSLGTYWCIESDTFGFRIELRDKPLTRRGILSTISSVYDPLGAVSPIILVGKQILQTLCRHNADWDDPVPEDIFHQDLEFQFTRKSIVFSDASDSGIGQVSYLRSVNEKNEVHVSFLMAKSRVAPLRAISIPRLELTAAVVSVNVASMLKRELDVENTKCLYYTDSEIVMGYINNDARRFHVYVGNRVQHIRDRSTPNMWHHVAGKNNPADEASRGLTTKELMESNRWFDGPTFLWQQEPLPLHAHRDFTLDSSDEELRKDSTSVLATEVIKCKGKEVFPETFEVQRFHHCSSLNRLKRSIVRIQRMIEKLRPNKQYNWRPQQGPPQVEELIQAETLILKSAQQHHFQAELKTLQNIDGNTDKFESRHKARHRNLKIKYISNIHKLDPFVDEKGFLRIGGRLQYSTSPYEIKHPIIMPKHSHITELLVREFHQGKQHHQGYGMTHNAIRQAGYHIINGRSEISHLIAKCITCRKLRSRTEEGRKELKRWGLIFTCLASRAIHLETLNAMTTDSFINGLRRFIARRGKASHMGGIWERQIRTTRAVLSSLLRDHCKQLDDEALRTLMTEAESIINCRPLTVEDISDPLAGEPITPNHLLTLKTQIVLPPPGNFEPPDLYSRKRWRRVQFLANQFWLRWQKEYCSQLQKRQKWQHPKRNMAAGDVVLVYNQEAPRSQWPLAVVTKTLPSKDGAVRKVEIQTCKNGEKKFFQRPIHKFISLFEASFSS